ncbi:MAG: hypothetical protein HZA61_00990 [Candidatus Eisenbacteria bacterium]|uniref:FlgD Ig-like domain-containing protein n=1 Tax=Eiseniibacteriota bacterium TaxID=2212470 RepID=A0A933W0K0_UNCEI|nr:hypothetical protein [Candidatus Eisenbacteria bacterium]
MAERIATSRRNSLGTLLWAALALACVALPDRAGATPPLRNAGVLMGTNLERVGSVGRTWVFVDVFKSSTGWSAQKSDGSPWTGAPLALDSLGWVSSLQPQQVAVARVLEAGGTHFRAGQYVALYDGQGTLDFGVDASVVSFAPGRVVLQITPSAAFTRVRLTATNPADPLRNLRIVRLADEGTYATQLFDPLFLQKLAPYRVIRFMNWFVVNNSPLVSWSERTRPGSATQGGLYGVAPEYMVELGNRLGADVWINIPHLADDDYVARLAALMRDSLDSDLRVFVEHSNELWGTFVQSSYARQQGMLQGLASDSATAAMRWHSARSVHLFQVFQSVFGSGPRLVRVLAGSHVNAPGGVALMDWQNAWQQADAYATAPYFGGVLGNAANGATTAQMSSAQILAALDQQSLLSQGYAATNAANAAARGLDYISYEGGQALYGQSGWQNDPAFAASIMAANRDPGMRPLYKAHLDRWAAAGGGLFMNFNLVTAYGGGGCWGVFEDMQQDTSTAYKFLGEMDYLRQQTLAVEPTPRAGPGRVSLVFGPVPTRGGGRFSWSGSTSEAPSIQIVDVTGRVRRRLVLRGSDGGAAWDGLDETGTPLAPGLYFARMASASGVPAARIVVTR